MSLHRPQPDVFIVSFTHRAQFALDVVPEAPASHAVVRFNLSAQGARVIRLIPLVVLALALAAPGGTAAARGGGTHAQGAAGTGSPSGSHAGQHSKRSGASGHTGKGHSTGHQGATAHTGKHGGHAARGAARDANGKIKRSAKAKAAFKKSHPCPSTGKSSGACPGYVIDHVTPLKRGGADSPANMQWQTTAAARAKDKTE